MKKKNNKIFKILYIYNKLRPIHLLSLNINVVAVKYLK